MSPRYIETWIKTPPSVTLSHQISHVIARDPSWALAVRSHRHLGHGMALACRLPKNTSDKIKLPYVCHQGI